MKAFKGWKIAAFLLLAVVFAGALTLTVSEAATPIDEAKIDVNYQTETITIETDDNIVYYTDVYSTDRTKWNACEVRNGKAAFDISWVSTSKNVRLYICGDVNEEIVGVDLVWKETLRVQFAGTLLSTDITEAEDWKAAYKGDGTYTTEDYSSFSEDTGYFIFTLNENGRDTSYFYLDNIEWRKGSEGVWRPLCELDLKEMNIRGIKLDFRVKSSDAPVTFSVYKNYGSRPSTVASISVQKLGVAPLIEVNPDMMTVAVRNGLEYSLDKQNWILIPAYNKKLGTPEYKVDKAAREAAVSKIYTTEKIIKLSVQEVLGLDMNAEMVANKLTGVQFATDDTGKEIGIKLYVRTAGDVKKAASKVTELVIPFAADGKSVAAANALEIYHGESKTRTGGIVVQNNSDVKYQVGVLLPTELVDENGRLLTKAEIDADMSKVWVDTATVKWTAVKEGKLMKFANSKVPEGSRLIYRIAGEDGYLPSTYLLSNEITYDVNTYAAVTYASKNVGDVFTATTSSNLTAASAGVTCQWQRCDNPKAENPVWTNIATGATYTTTDADANMYIRVVITYKGEERTSAPIGPMKLVK